MPIPLLTAPPTAPATNDPSTFDQRADALVAWHGTNVTEMNVVIPQINSAAETAEEAIVAAVEAEAARVGAIAASGVAKFNPATNYAEGACVFSAVNYKTYRRKAAGTSATDPSIDTANWTTPIPSATRSGVTTTNPMAANIVLTAQSSLWQVVFPNAHGLKITLPAAIEFAEAGTVVAVIQNDNHLYPVSVADSSGVIVGWVMPGRRIAFAPKDISTAAGVWITAGVDSAENGGFFMSPRMSNFAMQGSQFNNLCAIQVNDKYSLIFWIDGGNIIGRCFDMDSGGAAWSSTVYGGTNANSVEICMLTPTRFILGMQTSGSQFFWVYDVAANGNVTQYVPQTSLGSGGNGGGMRFSLISDTQVACMYTNGSGYPAFMIINLSGSAVLTSTYDTTLASSGAGIFGVVMLSATLGIMFYQTIKVRRFTVAAGVATLGTEVSTSGDGGFYHKAFFKVSAAAAMYFTNDPTTSRMKARLVLDTGVAAVSLGTLSGELADLASVGNYSAASPRLGRVVMYYRRTTYEYMMNAVSVEVVNNVPVLTGKAVIEMPAFATSNTTVLATPYNQHSILLHDFYVNATFNYYARRVGLA